MTKTQVRREELEEGRPFMYGHALEEGVSLLLFVGFILLLAATVHPSQFFEPTLDETDLRRLESPADPFNTPPEIVPEWYFVATFEMLKIMAPWMAMALTGLFILAFAFTPFIDRFMQRFSWGDRAIKWAGIAVIVVFLYFTLKGAKVVP
jgi:quinol-cytochrome oxidoreductase complex cytochrome b subunit